MTDAAERTVEGDVLTSGATAPFATDVVVPADVAPADVVVPAVDSHNELVSVFGRRTQYKYVVAIVYVTALFLDILDTTIVNVAIPALGEQFQSGAAEWIVLGYTVSLAVWIPASGWLGDRFGTKRIFLFALASFTFGSLLCSMSTSMGQLILFRVLQGVGGGMLTPVGIAMLFWAFPPAERAKAAMIVIIPALRACRAAGPVLGGLLVTHASWHWIFLINVPIGIVAFLFGWTHLREHREPGSGRFDAPGFVFSGGAARAHRLRPERRTIGRLGLETGRRQRRARRCLRYCVGVHGAPRGAPDARPAAAGRSPLSHLQHRRADLDGQLPRADVRDAAVPPAAAWPGCLDERPDDLPPGVRDHDLVARRRAPLPQDRA